MGSPVRYELLGPLRVVDNENSASLSAKKIEVVLVTLLIKAGQVVSTDQLIAEIWLDDPPRRAIAALYVYISQLRKFLARPDQRASPILTKPPGYLLRLGTDETDLQIFERLLNESRNHIRERQLDQALATLQRANALWRGPALSGVPHGPIIDGLAMWLEHAHLESVEMEVATRLELGQHSTIIADLYTLTTHHPLREIFHQQLMLALYRSGRRAEALQAYHSARRILNDELGLEPCRELKKLQQTVLGNE